MTRMTHPDAPAPVIEAHGLRVGYGGAADVLCDVDVTLTRGQVFCFVGPNGAGKSTLLGALAGIVPLRDGQVRLEGTPLSDISGRTRARRIGFLPQIVRPSIAYSVNELVALGRYAHSTGFGFETDRDRDAVERAMSLTHTGHLSERPFSTLSGGERQRVLIASVLAGEPEVLLLDEPTASLDITRSADVFAALEELAAMGRAVGVVTHDLNLAGQFGGEVALMSEGRVIADGAPGAVLTRERLHEAYGDGFVLVPRPGSDVPAVLPAGKAERS